MQGTILTESTGYPMHRLLEFVTVKFTNVAKT